MALRYLKAMPEVTDVRAGLGAGKKRLYLKYPDITAEEKDEVEAGLDELVARIPIRSKTKELMELVKDANRLFMNIADYTSISASD